MSRVVRALRTVDYRLWRVLFFTLLIPVLYKTVRIYFLGSMSADSGINIASQLAWISLFYEVAEEALIVPLYHMFGKSVTDTPVLENKIRSGLIVVACLFLLISLIVIFFAGYLVDFMAQNATLREATIVYVRLECMGFLFGVTFKLLSIVLVVLEKNVFIWIVLATQMVLSILCDLFLISDLQFSARIGVNGIAISTIFVNFILFISIIVMLHTDGIRIFRKQKLSFSWMKEWLRVGFWSGTESLLRNLTFMIMIIRMVNIASGQGIYWIANSFVWGWLLLPSLALGEVIQKETGADP